MCLRTLVAAEFLAGTTGIGFVENVAKNIFNMKLFGSRFLLWVCLVYYLI